MNVWIVALIVFVLNLPFGYWRANVKKFSLQWILSIHVPVPFVILLRIYSNIGFAFITYPILVGAFFGGQFVGKTIHSKIKEVSRISPGSCLVTDVYRIFGDK